MAVAEGPCGICRALGRRVQGKGHGASQKAGGLGSNIGFVPNLG